jgi:serine/threonine protein kinase
MQMVKVDKNSILKKRYVLEEVIGTDQTGTIFLALDLRQKEAGVVEDHVAVKVLNEKVVSNTGLLFSLQEEASRARRLQCENIVTIYDYDRDDEICFLVMELLNGETLEVHLANRDKRLPRKEAYQIIKGICLALELAHEREVLHTNLCPARIFYTTGKVAKLFDFGVGDLLEGDEPCIYASPEKLKTGKSSESDDIFSAAVVSYQLLTGKHPFGGHPASTDSPAPRRILSIMPGRWCALARGLALDPGDRVTSIKEFSEGLLK